MESKVQFSPELLIFGGTVNKADFPEVQVYGNGCLAYHIMQAEQGP